MVNEMKKKRAAKAVVPKRTPGEPIARPHVSRVNPLADLLFGSLTPEMLQAADRGEEWPNNSDDNRSAKDRGHSSNPSNTALKSAKRSQPTNTFSTGAPDFGALSPPDSGGVKNEGAPESGGVHANGFLAVPHTFLDQVFSNIPHYSAFKVYLYLYRIAFRWIHDPKVLSAKCDVQLATLARDCTMPDSVVREALKILIRDRWITVETRPGRHSLYLIHRSTGAPESGGVGAPDSGGDLKNHHDKNIDNKERRSSSKKRAHDDDESLTIIKQIYQELTNNKWTDKDTASYAALPDNLAAEDIIRYLRAIHERTNKPVGSFAYFAKAITREEQSPKNRSTTIKKLRQIVTAVRTASTGRADYSPADFREDVKSAAARQSIPYTTDLLEEALKP